VYPKYFQEIRDSNRPVKLLEIGAFMGQSIVLWKQYLPSAQLFFIEYSEAWVRPWMREWATMFVGDQSNVDFLHHVVNQTGQLDMIIDDGGHTMKQQLVSFTTLWPFLKPGGVFFIEDMHASYTAVAQP